jgi:SAM-dependent methyltransferase
MQATLLDLDPLALEQATFRLASTLPPQNISARRENLYRLARAPNAAELLDADLIACTGFFDYLNDKDATALLARFWQELRPGGRLMVFNFAPHNPSRALMEWIGNWYLVYRDEAAMQRLAVDAGIPARAFQISAEQEGIDLFIDAVKPGCP